MIYLITNREQCYEGIIDDVNISLATVMDFKIWYKQQKATNLDSETNVTEGLYHYKKIGPKSKRVFELSPSGEKIPERRVVYTIQIGDILEQDQFIFDLPLDNNRTREALIDYFISDKPKYLHNTLFDSTVIIMNFGVNPKKVKDTMLLSQILHTGLDMPKGFHSYAGCLDRYLNVSISKDEQTTFDGQPMSRNQIEYACIDVLFPHKLYELMMVDISNWGLNNVVVLEEAVVRAYAASMCDNFYLNIEAWRDNIADQEQQLAAAELELKNYIMENFSKEIVELGFMRKEEEYDFNWRSSSKVQAICKELFPGIDMNTKPLRVQYYKTLDPLSEQASMLKMLNEGMYEQLEMRLISRYPEILVKTGIYKPANELEINFNSNEQTLALFQLIKPNLTAVNKKSLSKIKHPLKTAFDNYNKAAKMVQSYGQNFIDCVNPDGMLRPPDYKQILTTGRTSMKLYQLLPKNIGPYSSNIIG